MKVRICYKSYFAGMIVGKNITLYPFIFMVADEATSRANHMLAHEWIHIQQIRENGFWRFYSSYLWFYIKGVFKYRSLEQAYLDIPWEKQAYLGQDTFELPGVLE